MTRSVNAVLLSVFVFPGAGQFYLGRRVRGSMFMLLALAAALCFLVQIAEPVMAIALDISSGSMAPDPLAIVTRLHQRNSGDNPFTNLAASFMMACWIGSGVDAWRLGR